jgi:hypothetical protein
MPHRQGDPAGVLGSDAGRVWRGQVSYPARPDPSPCGIAVAPAARSITVPQQRRLRRPSLPSAPDPLPPQIPFRPSFPSFVPPALNLAVFGRFGGKVCTCKPGWGHRDCSHPDCAIGVYVHPPFCDARCTEHVGGTTRPCGVAAYAIYLGTSAWHAAAPTQTRRRAYRL